MNKVNNARRRRLYKNQFGDYADLIREMPCIVCEQRPSDPHHTKSRGAGGDQSSIVPLCRRCHALLHTMGRRSFENRFLIDLESEAATLWAEYHPETVTGSSWEDSSGG